MTHEEMIAVIQAHEEGKVVEWKLRNESIDDSWEELDPTYKDFDFINCDYRIKPESHYRPFKNAREVMEAIKEHGYYIKWGGDGKDYIIAVVCDDYIEPYNDESYTFAEAFESFTWPDGTPFGVKGD